MLELLFNWLNLRLGSLDSESPSILILITLLVWWVLRNRLSKRSALKNGGPDFGTMAGAKYLYRIVCSWNKYLATWVNPGVASSLDLVSLRGLLDRLSADEERTLAPLFVPPRKLYKRKEKREEEDLVEDGDGGAGDTDE